MAKNVRAFRNRAKPGRCPSCGKKGLSLPRTVVSNSAWSRWRDCRYCGESVNIDRSPEDAEHFFAITTEASGSSPSSTDGGKNGG